MKINPRCAVVAMLILGLQSLALAEEIRYPDFKTSSAFSQSLQRFTGVTAVTGWAANRILKRELSQELGGHLHSRLHLYSASDLWSGRAQGLTLQGQNLLLDKFIPLSQLELRSDANTPIMLYKGRKPFLLRPVHFQVKAVMNETDINRMLQSEKGRKMLTELKVKLPPFGTQRLDALEPSVRFDNDQIAVQSKVNIHGAPVEEAIPVQLTGRLQAEKSRLKLSDLNLQIEGLADTEAIASFVQQYFGEIVNLSNLKISRHRVKILFEEAKITEQQLVLKGTAEVTPERKLIQQFLAKQK